MAIYVVDTNVVIKRFITEIYTPEVRVLLAQMERGDRLYLPEFSLLECVNILWKEVRLGFVKITFLNQPLQTLQIAEIGIEREFLN